MRKLKPVHVAIGMVKEIGLHNLAPVNKNTKEMEFRFFQSFFAAAPDGKMNLDRAYHNKRWLQRKLTGLVPCYMGMDSNMANDMTKTTVQALADKETLFRQESHMPNR